MRSLRVQKFSSINEAHLQIAPITLLIGPQASGKSVLCKLSYFFVGLLDEQVRSITELRTHDQFVDQVKSKFVQWFPPETWGRQKFEIVFSFGDADVQVLRTVSGGRAGKGIKVKFSGKLCSHYNESLEMAQSRSDKKSAEPSELTYNYFVLQRTVRESLNKRLGTDFVSSQIFIPAARSFFTSIGKAIAAFESSNMLDPITVTFGRLYTARDVQFYSDNPEDRLIRSRIDRATVDMLGGEVVREREQDREILKTPDGRTIPLGLLSSGQQELFPLLRALPRTAAKGARRLIYVEEPEAHLFPNAQSRLVLLLSTLMNAYGSSVDMIITTHSPYVLTKFNNLLLAGQLGRRRGKSGAVASISAQESWIGNGRLTAYALDSGKLNSVMTSDGLVNGNYLDEVSNQISSEYTRLLDVEFEDRSPAISLELA